MSDDTRKVRRKLATLTNSLDDLETRLAPLLSQSLPELILSLDTIQQAKLQVVIPYLVYDLVFGPSPKPPSLSARGSTHRHSLQST
jgi:exosome complex protein LRP1